MYKINGGTTNKNGKINHLVSLEPRASEYLPNVELTLIRLAFLGVVFSGGGEGRAIYNLTLLSYFKKNY